MMQDRTTPSNYRPDIDGLRAIAVLAVVGFHAFPRWIKGGFVGVDIFFVISGYLISSIILHDLKRGKFSVLEFYSRRVRRIFPALILVLAFCFALGWLVLLAGEYQQLGKHGAAGAVFISNFVFWNESGYFDNAAETKPFLHLWSLGIEEQFYVIWPLLLWFGWQFKSRIFGVVFAVWAISFASNLVHIQNDQVAAFFSPLSRFWELMIGGAAALIQQGAYSATRARPNILSFSGLAMLSASLALTDSYKAFPGWWALLPTLGTFLIITAGRDAWLNGKFLSRAPLVWLGLISYPLYLWHWPVLSFMRILEGHTPSREMRISAIAISLLLAWLTYRYLEKPIRFGHRPTRVVALLFLGMVATGLAGFAIHAANGYPQRTVLGTRAAYGYNWEEGYRYGRCFIDASSISSSSSSFAPYCSGATRENGSRPLVLLWGDSHAASLYRGLQHHADAYRYAVAQFTANGCPPVHRHIFSKRKMCEEVNNHVLSRIRELKPEAVVLAAYWSMYSGKNGWDELDYSKLKATLSAIRESGVDNITLVGHLPVFMGDQPQIGLNAFRDSGRDRTYTGFNEGAVEVDRRVRELAREAGVGFVSPIDLLCNLEGCLMSASTTEFQPLAWDYGHLTDVGSATLIRLAIENKAFIPPRSDR